MAKKNETKVGAIAFIICIVIALIAGLLVELIGQVWTTTLLILLGILVGFLNVTDKEVKDYLFTAVCLVLVTTIGSAAFNGIAYIGPYLANVLQAIMTFVIPATIIVALKEIYNLAKD